MAVSRVKSFVDRALNFNNLRVKVLTVADLADILWKHDEQYSRQILLKLLDTLSSEAAVATDETASNRPQWSQQTINYLRTVVIARIARHDATLAKRLIDADRATNSPENSRYSDLLTATRLLQSNDTAGATEFAERSLKNGVSEMLVGVLFGLHKRDEAAANNLFMKAVNSISAQPAVDANDLLWLGAYVFTAPDTDPSEYSGIEMINVMSGTLIPNIAADRPSASPAAVRAYLDAAFTILTRSVSDPRQQQLYYVAA